MNAPTTRPAGTPKDQNKAEEPLAPVSSARSQAGPSAPRPAGAVESPVAKDSAKPALVATPAPAKPAPVAAPPAAAAPPVQTPTAARRDDLPAVVKPTPTPAPAPKPSAPPVLPPAAKSQFRQRHFLVLVSFLVMVLVPAFVSAWYLWTRAADQYASSVAFSVRTEEQGSAIASLLGSVQLGGSSTASDAEVLYKFIQSQSMVASLDEKLDLRGIWSKADPAVDPVFAYYPPGTIEDLLDHWTRKVKIFYDNGTGLIELRVLAFDPADAKAIAEAIYAESTAMINQLSAIAREDGIGYARDELDLAVERLKVARTALTEFRNRTQIVDPTVDLQGQAGLLNTLNQQLAAALIEADLLKQTTRDDDPRISQAERKIGVIETRIEDEKRKLGIGASGTGTDAFATLVGDYERLQVDRQFAEQTYTAALASYDGAQAEARRQSRYLAAHVRPTLAERSDFPKRLTLFGLVALFSFLLWSITVLVGYSLRDRR